MHEVVMARGRRVRGAPAAGVAAWALLAALAGPAIAPAAASPAPVAPRGAPTPSPPAASPGPAQAPPERPVPESIPVPEVARRADEVAAALRELDALLGPDALIESAERRLPALAAGITAELAATDRQLDTAPPAAVLDGLAAQWHVTRAEMGGYVNVLAQRATALEAAMARLETLHERWTRARADALASRAPAPVIGRIDGVLASLATARARAQAQRAAALVSQDRFAHEVARCEAVLARLARSRQQLTGRLLARDAAPLWRGGELGEAIAGLPGQVRDAVAAERALLRRFALDQREHILAHVALFLALVPLLHAARRRVSRRSGSDPAIARPFERPLAAAVLLAVIAVPWIYTPPVPRAVVALVSVVALVPAIMVMRHLLDASLIPGLYLLGAFFLIDLVRNSAAVVPSLERLLLLLEMLAGVLVLGWWVASRRPRPEASPVTRGRAGWTAAVVVLAAFAAALVAGAAGYTGLALLLGGRLLGSAYLALVLYAGVRIADGLVALALGARPLRYLGMVQRQRPSIERRIHGVLRWVAVAMWLVFTLRAAGLWGGAVALARSALAAELRVGSLAVSLGDVLVLVVAVAAAAAVSAAVRFALTEDVYPRLNLMRGLPNALSSLLHYTLLAAGFVLALSVLGVDLTKVTILAGAVGVGVGFGLQHVVHNFVSGAIVLFERKINVGDSVQIGDVSGEVQAIGMRACTVRTWEGAEVIVPNASLTSDKVTNWTLSDRRRRIDVPVGVAFDTKPAQVQDVMLDVARAHQLVLASPPPLALFLGAGESALRFELRVWTDRFERSPETRSELTVALYAALGHAGIAIPLPQREVHVRRH